MGGSGGFNPLSVISSLIFGTLSSSSGSKSSSSSTDEAAVEAAEERRQAARKKTESGLLAAAHERERASLASENQQAQTLGEPSVAASGLKEKLGQ